jgi:REP element-mobilizing transposase RayT
MSDFLDPSEEIKKHGSKLPHWQQDGVMQFVTFRLGDSLPHTQLAEWMESRKIFLEQNPKPWTEKSEFEFHRRFTQRFEEWLDAGAGSCLFRQPEARELMEGILMKFQGERYIHESWVIMPNHLHLLFKPLAPMEKLIQAWKSTFSHRYGQGSIWQERYRDTLIRDPKHFANCVRYIRRNPRHLPKETFTLWESDRAKKISAYKE